MKKTDKIANNPIRDNLLPHLRINLNSNFPKVVFLPGDPSRVDIFKENADEFEYLSKNREFVVGKGIYKNRRFGVCSTGIGSGSTEIALIELFELGCKSFIRVGGCGTLDKDINCGDIIINSGMVRLGGSSINYAPKEYPAVADPELLVTLLNTCRKFSEKCHVGIGASVDSYYKGQGRNIAGLKIDFKTKIFDEMMNLNVMNFDMETETIYTLSSLNEARAVNLLAVHGNRVTNEWLSDYKSVQQKVVRIGLESLIEL